MKKQEKITLFASFQSKTFHTCREVIDFQPAVEFNWNKQSLSFDLRLY